MLGVELGEQVIANACLAQRRPGDALLAVMLHGRRPHATIPASDLARARAWYAEKLGFTTDQEEAAALLYWHGQDRLFLLFSSPDAGTARHQLAAWEVDDLEAEIAELRAPEALSLKNTISRGCTRLRGLQPPRSVTRPGSKTVKATCSPSLRSIVGTSQVTERYWRLSTRVSVDSEAATPSLTPVARTPGR